MIVEVEKGKNLPVWLIRNTLCEMSVNKHLYLIFTPAMQPMKLISIRTSCGHDKFSNASILEVH